MPKLSVVAPPSPLPVRKPPVSAPRERLKELLDQRVRAAARIADLEKANGRLNTIFEALIPAKTALDRFEADVADAMLSWSKNPLKADPPAVNSDEKFKLMSALNDAQNQAAAANATRAKLTAAIQREYLSSHALEPAIREVIVEIIVESAAPLVEEIKEMQAALAYKRATVNQAIAEAHAIARSTIPGTLPGQPMYVGGDMTPEQAIAITRRAMPVSVPVGSTVAMIAGLVETFHATAGAPLVGATPADVAAWKSLYQRLWTDPAAELEG
jgi:hypothetical protein